MGLAVISSENGFDSAIRSSNLVVVDFYAPWCGPCRTLTPHLERLSTEYPAVRFCKLDVDSLDAVANSQNVSALPTIVYYKNGKEVARVTGADLAKIEALINKHK